MWTQLLYAFAISLLVAGIARWRRSLSYSGFWGALIVGTFIFGFGGWLWGVLLGLFFVSSSLLSHFKEDEKKRVAEKFDKGHERDFIQTMANGGLGALVAFCSAIWPWAGWLPIFIGIMATVNADTWATELGTLSRRPPRLITTGRVVEPGTSGAISLFGTIITWLGGELIGLASGLLSMEITIWLGLACGGLGGLVGSLLDSLLGATWQRLYYSDTHQRETEKKVYKGEETRPIRGWSWMTNDVVNLIASLGGGLVSLLVWLVFA